MSNKKHLLHERHDFTNVRELAEWAAEEYKNKCAFSYKYEKNTVKVTYKQFCDHVRAVASELISLGCEGKHCAVIGKPSYQWVVMYYAILSAGAVLVPLDRDWTAKDLADTVKNADCEFLFCDGDIADKADVICAENGRLNHVVFLNTKEKENNFDAFLSSGEEKYNSSPERYHNAPIDPMKMSLLVFTSGTTGKGKGVMLSQNAVLSDMSDAIPYIDFTDKTVSVLPLHHTYGSTVMLIGHVMIGSEVYISSGIKYIQRELVEQKPGHLVLVPLYLETFYRKIKTNIKDQGKEKTVEKAIKLSNALRKIGIDRRADFFKQIQAVFGGRLKMVITGGAPVNADILHFFDSVGVSMLNGYGITECAPLIAVNRSKNIVKGSVGNVLDMDSVYINEPNEDGEGEIFVKGPNIMLGYYKDQTATADAFEKGYFKTGDYGKLSKDGVLYITGRKKNLIILSNGKNVYPEEIENYLVSVPGLSEIIVYEGQSKRGVHNNANVAEIYPDYDWFEKNGITDINAYFKEYVNEYNKNAVPYKKIGLVKIRKTEFPKNTLRKIMRFKLDMTIE